MKRCLTVIITFNGEQYIEKCLKSLRSSATITDVMIVDNCSIDNTIQIVRSCEFEIINLVELKHNIGFGSANNIALRYALDHKYDFVFLLNQDAYMDKNALEKLIEVADNEKYFAVYSPLHLNGNGTSLDFYFSNYISPNGCPSFYSDAVLNKKLKKVYEASYINAAAWLIPVSTIFSVGGFDPLFFHYGEDDNYMQRLRFHGLKIGLCPNAAIYHDRDDRPPSIEDDITIEKRLYLIKFANINIDARSFIDKEVKLLKRSYLIASIKMSPIRHKIREKIDFLVKNKNAILESWTQNRLKGLNHLENFVKT